MDPFRKFGIKITHEKVVEASKYRRYTLKDASSSLKAILINAILLVGQ